MKWLLVLLLTGCVASAEMETDGPYVRMPQYEEFCLKQPESELCHDE
jgi:hypothetical protein